MKQINEIRGAGNHKQVNLKIIQATRRVAIVQTSTSISLNHTLVGLYNTQVTLVLVFPRVLYWFCLIVLGFSKCSVI